MSAEEDMRVARKVLHDIREEGKFPACSDDSICPEGMSVDYRGYHRDNPVLVCTLPDGHEGDHVAHGLTGSDGTDDIIATWARGTGRAG